MEESIEIWACKRYSKKHPGACVEPGKIKVISLKECEETLERELTKQEIMFRRNIKKLETEVDKLKTSKKQNRI